MPLNKDEKTLFFPAKYTSYAKKIHIDNPRNAQKSAKFLLNEYKKAKTRDKRNRLVRFAVLAMNRAIALQGKHDLSQRERTELNEVAKIYKSAINKMRR